MASNEKEFQEKIRQLGALVGELDQMPVGASKTAARELVQFLMDVHGTGLERMMELVFDLGEPGEALIRKFGQDPIVRNLLLLYSLHPDNLETRVLKALETARARLRKSDAEVELESIHDGEIQLRLRTSGRDCGSTAKNLQSIVEENVYNMAPDLTSLTILGSEDEPPSGFVPLETLLKHPAAAQAIAVSTVEIEGAD